jgi:hypothetical protein
MRNREYFSAEFSLECVGDFRFEIKEEEVEI